MIFTWACGQCGWANDNNLGACRRCGGDEDSGGKIRVRADQAKIMTFDALRGAQASVKDGGRYDRRLTPP